MSVLETVLHSTLTRSRKKLLFAAVKANAFYSYAMSKDMVEYEDGGKDITNPIILGTLIGLWLVISGVLKLMDG